MVTVTRLYLTAILACVLLPTCVHPVGANTTAISEDEGLCCRDDTDCDGRDLACANVCGTESDCCARLCSQDIDCGGEVNSCRSAADPAHEAANLTFCANLDSCRERDNVNGGLIALYIVFGLLICGIALGVGICRWRRVCCFARPEKEGPQVELLPMPVNDDFLRDRGSTSPMMSNPPYTPPSGRASTHLFSVEPGAAPPPYNPEDSTSDGSIAGSSSSSQFLNSETATLSGGGCLPRDDQLTIPEKAHFWGARTHYPPVLYLDVRGAKVGGKLVGRLVFEETNQIGEIAVSMRMEEKSSWTTDDGEGGGSTHHGKSGVKRKLASTTVWRCEDGNVDEGIASVPEVFAVDFCLRVPDDWLPSLSVGGSGVSTTLTIVALDKRARTLFSRDQLVEIFQAMQARKREPIHTEAELLAWDPVTIRLQTDPLVTFSAEPPRMRVDVLPGAGALVKKMKVKLKLTLFLRAGHMDSNRHKTTTFAKWSSSADNPDHAETAVRLEIPTVNEHLFAASYAIKVKAKVVKLGTRKIKKVSHVFSNVRVSQPLMEEAMCGAVCIPGIETPVVGPLRRAVVVIIRGANDLPPKPLKHASACFLLEGEQVPTIADHVFSTQGVRKAPDPDFMSLKGQHVFAWFVGPEEQAGTLYVEVLYGGGSCYAAVDLSPLCAVKGRKSHAGALVSPIAAIDGFAELQRHALGQWKSTASRGGFRGRVFLQVGIIGEANHGTLAQRKLEVRK